MIGTDHTMIQDQFMILMIITMKKWCNIKLIAGEIRSKAWCTRLIILQCSCVSVCLQWLYKIHWMHVLFLTCVIAHPNNLIGQTFTRRMKLNIFHSCVISCIYAGMSTRILCNIANLNNKDTKEFTFYNVHF